MTDSAVSVARTIASDPWVPALILTLVSLGVVTGASIGAAVFRAFPAVVAYVVVDRAAARYHTGSWAGTRDDVE